MVDKITQLNTMIRRKNEIIIDLNSKIIVPTTNGYKAVKRGIDPAKDTLLRTELERIRTKITELEEELGIE